MRKLPIATAAFALAVGSAAPALADPPPPSDAMPLSQILETLEQESGFSHFKDIEWDDGVWEIEYRTDEDREVRVDVDPVSGESR
ncbi:PepSY domain-containing protein [Aquibaculum arenosum]|uniref:PepSY domain-containing protein n=1 Tax=Aquibaculum arenosum TaxID=3032591 RepID=A0ABT5YL13_9PROT|nr:PepSY domain-containing protein [Fodinicurvata sp. CAU 1616]MDF2095640.1 PepSY domain-containing protein [Fodinicurvata sp. CAU 1616]